MASAQFPVQPVAVVTNDGLSRTDGVDFEESRRHDKVFPGEHEIYKLKANLCSSISCCATFFGMNKVMVTNERVVVASGNWCNRSVVSDDSRMCTRTMHTDSGAYIIYYTLLAIALSLLGILCVLQGSDDDTTTKAGIICFALAGLCILKVVLSICCREIYVKFCFEDRFYPIWFTGVRCKVSEYDRGNIEAAVRGVRDGVVAVAGERTVSDPLHGEVEKFHCRTEDGHITVTNKRVMVAHVPTCCFGCCLCDVFFCGSRTTVIDNVEHIGRVEAKATPLFPHADKIGLLLMLCSIVLFVVASKEVNDDSKCVEAIFGALFLLVGLFLYLFRPFYLAVYNARLPLEYPSYSRVLRGNSGRIAFAISHAIREVQAAAAAPKPAGDFEPLHALPVPATYIGHAFAPQPLAKNEEGNSEQTLQATAWPPSTEQEEEEGLNAGSPTCAVPVVD